MLVDAGVLLLADTGLGPLMEVVLVADVRQKERWLTSVVICYISTVTECETDFEL